MISKELQEKAIPILKRAVVAFGSAHALRKVCEECGEYVEAYCHLLDERPNSDKKLLEELVGVKLTVMKAEMVVDKQEYEATFEEQLNKLLSQVIKKEQQNTQLLAQDA